MLKTTCLTFTLLASASLYASESFNTMPERLLKVPDSILSLSKRSHPTPQDTRYSHCYEPKSTLAQDIRKILASWTTTGIRLPKEIKLVSAEKLY